MNPPIFESLDHLADMTATNLAQASAGAAFELFKDKRFRRLARLEQIDQIEQDRIFNERVIAYLTLIMLLLEAPDLREAGESRGYLKGLSPRIPKAYVEHLKTLGIGVEHLRDWDKLSAMRYDEYARDKHDVRAAAMQLESAEKNLDLDDLSKIQLLLPVQTVAIGCHHQICRGKTDGQDELFKTILKSLSIFYVELRVRLEGGKITPITRARMAARRMFRR